jgi:N-acetyl-gamma-glutamyl-phosphate reductase
MSSSKKIRAALVGATGYAGQELVRLLSQHPEVEITALTSKQYAGHDIADTFPNLRKAVSFECSEEDVDGIAKSIDVLFLALPHGVASTLVTAKLLEHARVIDLGSDFRLKNPQDYVTWYHAAHENPKLLEQAVYGLCEWNRDRVKSTRLVANPGCYATCVNLSLAPLVKAGAVVPGSIVVDAKSGVSGAGRALALGAHFNECNETIKAYGVGSHRHTPEIEDHLSSLSKQPVKLTFTPHLVPMNRGILVTAYAALKDGLDYGAVQSIYKDCYGNEPFIRLYASSDDKQELPETRWVKGSNYCDIGFVLDRRTGRLVVVGALDNLVKGAAGQAVQNMNIMFGLPETTGLTQVPLFPG